MSKKPTYEELEQRVKELEEEISGGKQAKQENRDCPHLLQEIIDNIDGEVFIKDTNGKYLFVNKAYEKDFGVDKNEIIGKDDYSVFSPEVAERLQENDKRIMESKISEMVEESGEVNGNLTTYRTNKVPLIDEDGEVYGICGIGFDITQQKRLEEALRKSENEMRIVTNNVPALIAYVDKEQVYRFTNRGYQESVRHSQEEIQGKTIKEILGEKGYEMIQHHIEQALSGQRIEFETLMTFEDDRNRYMNAIYVPYLKEGAVDGFFALIVDITERKKIEEEREKLINELQRALKEIKTLRGILPLCSFCKKIRDDKGYWEKVDVYIHQHTEADISHSICPACSNEHYPDLDIYDD